MRIRTKRNLFALVGLTAVIIVVVLAFGGRPRGRLLDGTEVILLNVSYGTNHIAPKAPLDTVLRYLPKEWLARIGWNLSSSEKRTTAGPCFSFWLEFSSPTATTQAISYAIADEDGFEANMTFDGPHGSYTPGGLSKASVGFVCGTSTFPRRSGEYFLRLYQQAGNGERFKAAEFLIKNAGFQNGREWTPQDVPVQHQTNGLDFSLIKAEVGVSPPGALVAPYNLQVGEWSEFRFRVTSHGEPSAGWGVSEMWISEATGDRIRMSAQGRSSFNGQFGWMAGHEIVCLYRWPFWKGERAWKLRVHFEQGGDADYWIEYLVRPQFLNTRSESGGKGEQTDSPNDGPATSVENWGGPGGAVSGNLGGSADLSLAASTALKRASRPWP